MSLKISQTSANYYQNNRKFVDDDKSDKKNCSTPISKEIKGNHQNETAENVKQKCGMNILPIMSIGLVNPGIGTILAINNIQKTLEAQEAIKKESSQLNKVG